MSLKDRIAEFNAKRNRPPEIMAIVQRGDAYVKDSGASGLHIGEHAPDFIIPIDILSDATSEVLKKYRLWFAVPAEVKALYLEKFGINLEKYNGAGRWELPVPATYVLDKDGIVRAGQADPDYTIRMEPAEVVAAVREIGNRR